MVNSYSVFFAAAAAFYVAGPSLALPQPEPGLVEYSDSVAARELSDSYLEAREPEDFARNDGREVKNDPKAAKGKNPKKKSHSKCKALKGAKRAACLKAKKAPKSQNKSKGNGDQTKGKKKDAVKQNKREFEDVLETRSFDEDLYLEAREPEDFARNDGREVKNDPKAAKAKNPKKKSDSKCKALKGAKRAACLKASKAAKKGKQGKKTPEGNGKETKGTKKDADKQNKRGLEDVLETRSFDEDFMLSVLRRASENELEAREDTPLDELD